MTERRGELCARGFTIVEVIVVMIILGVLGALVVPRLVGVSARQGEVEAQGVRSLLSAFAQRDAISRQSVALAFDAAKGELSVQTLAPADQRGGGLSGLGGGGGGGSAGSGSSNGAGGDGGGVELPSDGVPSALAWRTTAMIRPVRLSVLSVREVLVGGLPQPVDADWRVTISPAQTRPALLLLVANKSGGDQGRVWQIDLASSATGATLRATASGGAALSVDEQAEDLDKQGRRGSAW